MWNAKMDDSQAGIKIARRNSNNLRCVDDITLMAEREEELKSLLMRVNKESEKASLKLNIERNWDHDIWSHHFMANRGEKWNLWQILFSWPPKSLCMVIAAMKWKTLALCKKSYNKPREHFKKQRHHSADKSPYSQSCFFPVVMYGCESWTIKKAEHGCINAFALWWWKRLLRVLWTVRISNQSILKEIKLEYSLEGQMLKLKL